MNQIERKNELLDIYVEDEGVSLLCECLREASRALGIRYSTADLLMSENRILGICTKGAWMKRIGRN